MCELTEVRITGRCMYCRTRTTEVVMECETYYEQEAAPGVRLYSCRGKKDGGECGQRLVWCFVQDLTEEGEACAG